MLDPDGSRLRPSIRGAAAGVRQQRRCTPRPAGSPPTDPRGGPARHRDVVRRPRRTWPATAPTGTPSDDRDRRAATVPNRRARYGSERRQRGHRPHRAVPRSGDPRGREGRPAAALHHPDPQAAGADRRRALDPRDRAAAARAGQGFAKATLAIGHLGQLIRAYVGDGSQWGIEVDYVNEESPLGTIGPAAAPRWTGCPSTSW